MRQDPIHGYAGLLTDTGEKGLETLIVESLVTEAKYERGQSEDYDREYAVDLGKLLAELEILQGERRETPGEKR